MWVSGPTVSPAWPLQGPASMVEALGLGLKAYVHLHLFPPFSEISLVLWGAPMVSQRNTGLVITGLLGQARRGRGLNPWVLKDE